MRPYSGGKRAWSIRVPLRSNICSQGVPARSTASEMAFPSRSHQASPARSVSWRGSSASAASINRNGERRISKVTSAPMESGRRMLGGGERRVKPAGGLRWRENSPGNGSDADSAKALLHIRDGQARAASASHGGNQLDEHIVNLIHGAVHNAQALFSVLQHRGLSYFEEGLADVAIQLCNQNDSFLRAGQILAFFLCGHIEQQ